MLRTFNIFKKATLVPVSSYSTSVKSAALSSEKDNGGGRKAKRIGKLMTDPNTGRVRRVNNWDYVAELSALAIRLGFHLQDLPSLEKALECEPVEGTVSNHGSRDRSAMEPSRLSVLGRSSTLHYVNEHLYYSYPLMTGSMLVDLCISITNHDDLCNLSGHIGITDLIKTHLNLSNPYTAPVISQSFCAVIGAIYQDKGPKSCRKLVHELLISQLAGKDLEEVVKLQHPRLMLHSILSAQNRPNVQSKLISESGRATHFPSFQVGIFSGQDMLGEGVGTSLRRAEKEAMLTALRSYFLKELSKVPLPSDHEDVLSEEELERMMPIQK